MNKNNMNGTWVMINDDIFRDYKYVVPGYDMPRICIKCVQGDGFNKSNVYRIIQIYGDLIDNNLAPEMVDVLEEKINSMFSEGILYDWTVKYWKDKVLSYIKRVGNIYKKQMDGIDLNASELAFIYRLLKFDKSFIARKVGIRGDNYISFGNSPDSRMDEIISKRDHKKDFEKLSPEYRDEFLRIYNFPEVRVDDSNLVIQSGKIGCASDELLKDPKFIRRFMAAHKHCLILPYTKANINKNKKLVLEHFQNLVSDSYDNLLMYVSDKLKDDNDVVRLAIKINGNNIKDASDRLKNDKDTVILALLSDCDIKEEIFPLSMIEKYPEIKNIVDIIEIINVYSRIDDEEVKRVLSNNIVNLIRHSPPEIRSSYKIMKKAFYMNPDSLNFASPRVQSKLRK